MAACGSVHHFFEEPAEKSTLLESFPRWDQVKPVKPTKEPSYADDILSELLAEDDSISDSSASISSSENQSDDQNITNSSQVADHSHGCDFTNNKIDYLSSSIPKTSNAYCYSTSHKKTCNLSSYCSQSLEHCRERHGVERFEGVEDMTSNMNGDWQVRSETATPKKMLTSVRSFSEYGRMSRSSGTGEFPPPISSLGRDGKPRVSLRCFREDGRFILKKISTPSHAYFLHACREDGRLKLQLLPSIDDFQEDEEANEEKKRQIISSGRKFR